VAQEQDVIDAVHTTFAIRTAQASLFDGVSELRL